MYHSPVAGVLVSAEWLKHNLAGARVLDVRGEVVAQEPRYRAYPDRYRGETVKAFVVVKEGAELSADDVVEHCTQRLTAYKIPRHIEFRDALPQSDVGKVLRRMLREEELSKQGKQS